MATLNKVMIIGRLTRDPDRRATGGGLTVVDLGIAINERYKLKDGTAKERVCFIDVTVWGKTGEACAEYLRKGATCLVVGRLNQDAWEKDGQKRSKHTIVADEVQFLDRATDRGDQAQPPAQATQSREQSDDSGDGESIPF